jgi:hypothetical protein
VLFLFVSLSQPTDFLTGGSFTINFMFSNLVSCLLRRVEVLILAPFLSVLFLFVSLSQPKNEKGIGQVQEQKRQKHLLPQYNIT